MDDVEQGCFGTDPAAGERTAEKRLQISIFSDTSLSVRRLDGDFYTFFFFVQHVKPGGLFVLPLIPIFSRILKLHLPKCLITN